MSERASACLPASHILLSVVPPAGWSLRLEFGIISVFVLHIVYYIRRLLANFLRGVIS